MFNLGSWHNLGWLLAEKCLRLVLGTGTTLLIARHLGAGDFGALSTAHATVALLSFLPVLGLDLVVRRDLLEADDVAAARLLGTVFRLRMMVAGVIVAGIWLVLLLSGGGDVDERRLLAVVALGLFQPAMFIPELYFQAKAEAKVAARVQMLALLASAGGRLVLVLCAASLPWFGVVAVFEVGLTGWLLARRAGGAVGMDWWRQWDGCQARQLVRAGWPLLLAGAAVMLYMRIDMVMLRWLAGEWETGIYAAAVRLSEMAYFLPGVVITALLPQWERWRRVGGGVCQIGVQRIYMIQTVLACVLALPIWWLSQPLVEVAYGQEFAASGPVLAVHIWASVFVFQGATRSQHWVFENLNRLTLLTTIMGGGLNIALNALWIPRHGARGAALATLVAYAFAAWLAGLFFSEARRAWVLQTRALLFPITGWFYMRTRRDD